MFVYGYTHTQGESLFHKRSVSYFYSYKSLFYFFNLFILFIQFWLCWVFVAGCGLSLVAASGGYSPLQCTGFSLRWLLLLQSTGSRCVGFSSCDTWAQQLWHVGSRAQAQQLWRTGLVAPRHVGSSQSRARTRVPCIGRQILNHCATKEAQEFSPLRNKIFVLFLKKHILHRKFREYKQIQIQRNKIMTTHVKLICMVYIPNTHR